MYKYALFFFLIFLMACGSDTTESSAEVNDTNKGVEPKPKELVEQEKQAKVDADLALDAKNPLAQNPSIYQGMYTYMAETSVLADCPKSVRKIIVGDAVLVELEQRFSKLELPSRTEVYIEIEALQKARTLDNGKTYIDLEITKINDFQNIRSCPDDVNENSKFGN